MGQPCQGCETTFTCQVAEPRRGRSASRAAGTTAGALGRVEECRDRALRARAAPGCVAGMPEYARYEACLRLVRSQHDHEACRSGLPEQGKVSERHQLVANGV